VAEDVGAPVVAVGHHRRDQAETVLHHILRGTHLRGLAGIAPRRELASGVQLVRPVLDIDPARLRAYLRAEGLPWREDPTNADPRYTRNALRHRVLPEARRINPQADEALVRLARSAREVEAYLCEQAHRLIEEARCEDRVGLRYRRDRLAGVPAVLRRYVARGLLESSGVGMKHVSRQTLDELGALLDAERQAVSVPGGDRWFVEDGWVVREARDAHRPGPADWTVRLACPGRVRLPDGRSIACRLRGMDARAFAAHVRDEGQDVAWLDAERVEGMLCCRRAGRGESFVPMGASGARTVGRLLADAGVPPSRRDAAACVCDEAGIVWLAGVRLARRVGVEAATREVVEMSLR
jgi:tRNA(Ile)-lysidine synthase